MLNYLHFAECSSSTKPECCNLGYDFAVEVLLEHAFDEDTIDPYTICLGRTIHIAGVKDELGHNKYSYACMVHHFKKCVDQLYSAFGGKILNSSQHARPILIRDLHPMTFKTFCQNEKFLTMSSFAFNHNVFYSIQ